MRKLQILASASKGALPALLLATLLPSGASCSAGRETDVHGSAVGAGGGSGGSGGAMQTSTGSGGGFVTSTSSFNPVSSSGSGGGVCTNPSWTFTVDLPPEGVPADAGQICAVTMSPVESNRAARVTLAKDPQGLHIAQGTVEIDAALAGLIVGLPQIAVIDASPGAPELLGMLVTNVQPSATGFTFDAQWPPPLSLPAESWVRMTVRTTLEVKCDMQGTDTRVVTAITYVHLCVEQDDFAWVSSGDDCNVCDIIAEMAPSPIVPDKPADDLALGRALRLRITVLARIGRTLLLLAENDGGPGMSYDWQPSAGRIETLAPDIVMWVPPDERGPHLIQAAVTHDDAAAVASYIFQEVAA